jgi:hypothetical protein
MIVKGLILSGTQNEIHLGKSVKKIIEKIRKKISNLDMLALCFLAPLPSTPTFFIKRY